MRTLPSQSMTIGQHFINNEESQKISSSYRGKISVSMPRNEITCAGLTVQPQVIQEIVQPGTQRLAILNLLALGTTSSNAIEYTKETRFTNNAKPVVEGAAKPYSDLTFSNEVAMVKTIAHLFKAINHSVKEFKCIKNQHVVCLFGYRIVW